MAIGDNSNGDDIDLSKQDELVTNQSDPKKRKTHRLKQRFQVVKKLGQGTYGKVQLAINNETGQEVAIKTIKKSKVENDQDLVRIRREIQIMSSIQHPHITHIFEVFENKDKIVLVMQYASGGELYDYVSFKKVLSDVEARRLFRQIATAIYYCHKNKICHRDLKLENILLDEKGNAKIADFGLSNVFDEKHFLQTFCGSPLYASPEIVRGMSYFGPEVDCWSLGVLLYTLVYGAMPFDGSNFKKLVKQISESSYFEPANKSAASSLIKRLLTPNSSERATIIDICTDEWVNQDYEHSLLQVAEDLSNLTPVQLDLLLALAPTSPTETKKPDSFNAEATDVISQEDKSAQTPASNKRTIENASSNTSSNDLIEKKTIKKKPKKVGKVSKNTESESLENGANQLLDVLVTNNNTEAANIDKPEIKASDINPIKTIANQTNDADTVQKDTVLNPVKADKSESNVPFESPASPKATNSSNSLSGKRPGRLSIPKLFDNNQEMAADDLPKLDKKTPFIPVGLKVSDAKKVLERKCSVDLDSIGRRNSTELNDGKPKRDIKKYTSRSLSLNEIDTDKVKEKTIAIIKDKSGTIQENKTKIGVLSKPSTPVTDEDKSIAKQIIQKNIAKARLMEKRQISTTSTDSETTPLVSIENSNISIIKNAPKTCLDDKSPNENSFSNLSNYSKEINDSVMIQPSNAAPITRSYKKVTFTKDGACITESGKFFTREGKDGLMTRVEKKSKVTHIISGDSGAVSIQRSDSQSSSGSIDIFDDIFDDHWTGDGFISNMKSLFNNIFDSPRQITERKSLRSRAESLERSSNSLFSNRQNRKSTFMADNDFGTDSIFDTPKSLFSSKSIFSSSFKSNFDKYFDMNSSLSSLSSSQIKKETPRLNHSLPKPMRFARETSLHRDSDSFDSNRIFNDTEQDRQESTRNRVEQWLKSDDGKDFDQKMGNYGTIGPKNFRRYMKTMTANDTSTNNCFNKFEMSTAKSSSFSSNAVEEEVKTSSVSMQNITQKESVPRNSEIEVKFSLNDLNTKTAVNKTNISLNDSTNNMDNSSFSVTSSSSGIKIAEQSSLLEQLRTFGYKNLVSRRLSESSSTEDLCQNLSESQINSNHKSTE